MSFLYELIVILFMLTCTAICVAYEMALASISQPRINVLVHQKRRGANEAAFMKGRMEASLAIAQLGITLAAAIAAATGGAGIVESFSPYLHNSWGMSETISKIIALVVLIIPFTFFTISVRGIDSEGVRVRAQGTGRIATFPRDEVGGENHLTRHFGYGDRVQKSGKDIGKETRPKRDRRTGPAIV